MIKEEEVRSDECVEPTALPIDILPKYSLQPEQFEAGDVVSYVEGQAQGENVKHVEFIKEEIVLGRRYRVWDVTTDKCRWWVISDMTNLYSQEFFPSLDFTISFHIGLMARLAERDSAPPSEKAVQFGEIERRQTAVHEAYDIAVDAIEFQQIGLQLRETLLRVVAILPEFINFKDDFVEPRKGDFKAWAECIAGGLFQGRKNQALRKFVRSSSRECWELVSWLTHAQNADEMSCLIAMQSVDAMIGHFLFGLTRFESEGATECERCSSRKINIHFDINLGEQGESYLSCQSCGWHTHPSK
ncbi:hypothetical protein [Aliiroseovarius marinus]|uniref:hypothetical protein n=1 Tax=Aliiroseovarius marinus TaxID=2500159 RepID=UPI003D7CC957